MLDVRSRGEPIAVEVESAERWECRCRVPPVLLGTFERSGRINIKVRDRYWHVEGIVRTSCPRCGTEYVLDLRFHRPTDDSSDSLPGSTVQPR